MMWLTSGKWAVGRLNNREGHLAQGAANRRSPGQAGLEGSVCMAHSLFSSNSHTHPLVHAECELRALSLWRDGQVSELFDGVTPISGLDLLILSLPKHHLPLHSFPLCLSSSSQSSLILFFILPVTYVDEDCLGRYMKVGFSWHLYSNKFISLGNDPPFPSMIILCNKYPSNLLFFPWAQATFYAKEISHFVPW